MSAIASFYVVPGEHLTDIVAAATPAPGGWFRPARNRFRDVLRASGRELETFAWSGWVFNTLDLYLESRHGLLYANFGDAVASRQLSEARGSDWLVLPAAAAADLLALDGVECEAGDVTAFVASEHGPGDAVDGAVAVQAALTTLKAWLAEVSSESIGILSVGQQSRCSRGAIASCHNPVHPCRVPGCYDMTADERKKSCRSPG